jgi:AhpD family alkylhydroperoxidase
MVQVQPEAYKALYPLEQYINALQLPQLHQELIKIRASQINGCAYCVNLHTGEACRHGETEKRIFLLSVWREAFDVFTEEEQILLAMTEEITLIHQNGLSEALYQRAIILWGEARTAQVIMAIIAINAWNRIGVALKMNPDPNTMLLPNQDF